LVAATLALVPVRANVAVERAGADQRDHLVQGQATAATLTLDFGIDLSKMIVIDVSFMIG
jgi:hypothetical protein